jgi:hypothetical protein
MHDEHRDGASSTAGRTDATPAEPSQFVPCGREGFLYRIETVHMSRVSDQPRIYRGELGETEQSSVQISTDSGAIFQADVYDAINAAEDPELESSLFRGGLNRVESPFSDRIYHPAIPVRYHDPERRLFALVIPEALRHRELQLRQELLESLAADPEIVPDYVRNFEVVIGPSQLQHLADSKETSGEAPRRVRRLQSDGGDGAEETSFENDAATAPDGEPLPEALPEQIEDEREALEQERRELEQKREQLQEVSDRIDRERRQMDEVEQEIQQERRELEAMRENLEQEQQSLERQREELEQERQSIEAERLRLEEQRRSLESQREQSASDGAAEETQVVTEDQFISVAPDDQAHADSAPLPESEDATRDAVGTERTSGVEVEPLDREAFRDEDVSFESDDALEQRVEIVDGRVRAIARLDDDRAEELTDEPPEFFVQSHWIEDYPLAALAIARLDDDRRVEASFGWPLDLADADHGAVWETLAEETALEFALYRRSDDELAGAFEVEGPLEDNVEWVRHGLESDLDEDPEGTFEQASSSYLDPAFERVGAMRHNFDRQAFRQLATPAQVKLAAGVVGYWSDGEVFEYLISNRSYPMTEFRELQEDVVEAALETGIYLSEPLRALALELGMADDEAEIAERSMSNFAEVSVQIRGADNDLEPMDEWDNWEALIELAQDVGVTPDPDVIELAEASLKRAQRDRATDSKAEPSTDAPETDVREAPEVSDNEHVEDEEGARRDEEPTDDEPSDTETDEHDGEAESVGFGEGEIVEHADDATGITYHLPEEDVLESFEDLDEMSRDDLEKLLDDAHGRLEAAQTLVERFDSSVVPTVMEAVESMSGPERHALTRFLEPRAEVLEAELMQALESGGPAATSVAMRALAHIESKTALPSILDAYCDTDRALDRESLARALADHYGDTLIAPLTREIQRSGGGEEVALLLQGLEEVRGGILDELEEDRDESVREAVADARDTSL